VSAITHHRFHATHSNARNAYEADDAESMLGTLTRPTGVANVERLARIRRAQQRSRRPVTLTRVVILWATLAFVVALTGGIGNEAWARIQLEQRVAQTQQRNSAIRQEITRTNRAVSQAESPEIIEQRARAWGYARPGDHVVVIILPSH